MRFVRYGLQLIIIISGFLILLRLPGTVEASEGTFILANNDVVCKGVSVWDVSEYKILGRCQGLVYPFAEGYTTYVLWAVPVDGSRLERIGNIENGIIDGHADRAFNQLFVSPESNTDPDRPSGTEVLRGNMDDFRFSASAPTGEVRGVALLPSLTITPEPSLSPPPAGGRTPAPARAGTFSFSGLLGSVSLLALFVLVIIIVGILFVFWRSRS